ncbi:MAG: exodeoxyribonuclease VII small subunit [Bacillota bacterium]|nr:MAG: exodeoxyribonuclease VII small subunit [Bacillota bacterium]MBS3951317.1 exodeoxyribonuclease VII small subunit [Peptococcaceae bacterium]
MQFESAIKKLEEIVAKLEGGEVTLDEAMALYLAGVEALKNCEKLLIEAEQKVEIILRDERTAFVEG